MYRVLEAARHDLPHRIVRRVVLDAEGERAGGQQLAIARAEQRVALGARPHHDGAVGLLARDAGLALRGHSAVVAHAKAGPADRGGMGARKSDELRILELGLAISSPCHGVVRGPLLKQKRRYGAALLGLVCGRCLTGGGRPVHCVGDGDSLWQRDGATKLEYNLQSGRMDKRLTGHQARTQALQRLLHTCSGAERDAVQSVIDRERQVADASSATTALATTALASTAVPTTLTAAISATARVAFHPCPRRVLAYRLRPQLEVEG